MNEFKSRLKLILMNMRDRVVTPGDVVSLTGLPRYEVLATFHILEALNLVELINSKGNYRVYKLSELGIKLLKALEKESEVILKIESPNEGGNPNETASVTS